MKRYLAAGCVALALQGASSAQSVDITIENLQTSGGFAFTPFWLGLHDNSFDVFDNGAMSDAGLTAIAELGDTAPITGDFATAQPGGTQTTFAEPNGAPVFSPGESATTTLASTDPTVYRYLQFVSMVVPSNDLFVGNDAAIEIFDATGNFNGPITITLFGSDVYDNGTEVNDITDGPAFIQGVDATLGTDESAVIRSFFTDAGDAAYLSSVVGVITAPGDEITSTFAAGDAIAQITITPEPTTAMTLLLATMGLWRRIR